MNRRPAIFGCLGALVLGILLLGGCAASGYNSLVRSANVADTALANVNVQYQRRADLIGNLVKTVEGAANFEKSTLTEVVNARANATKVTLTPGDLSNPEALKRFQDAQNQLSAGLGRLLAVSENYPQLRANQNFRDLQAQLEGTENRIAVARGDFNRAIQGYNLSVKSFPTVLYAGLMGFSPRNFFQNAPGTENAPQVSFPSFGASPAASPR